MRKRNTLATLGSVLLLASGCALSTSAVASVEVERTGPFAVETGSWSAHLMRGDSPMRCPIGTATDCYFIYVDVRNNSDEILDCSARIRWDDGSIGSNSQNPSATIRPRNAYPIITVNGGARGKVPWDITCAARVHNSTTPPSTPSGNVSFEGAANYTISADRTQFTVQNSRIVNRRAGGTSGALAIEVWLAQQKGGSRGVSVAEIRLPPLQAGHSIPLSRTVTIAPTPPAGTYYVVYVLLESGNVVDRMNFDRPITVGRTPSPQSPSLASATTRSPASPSPSSSTGATSASGSSRQSSDRPTNQQIIADLLTKQIDRQSEPPAQPTVSPASAPANRNVDAEYCASIACERVSACTEEWTQKALSRYIMCRQDIPACEAQNRAMCEERAERCPVQCR